ncbi:MAG: SH3 domain-containing protein [Deltaproteobacteria bacterium]|nr:SH3 domain-containing protein [Deltaproteobacteria bacterium]
MKRYILIAAVFMAFALPAWAETVYVSKSRTTIRTEPNATSKVVATMDAGEPLEVVDRAERFLQVRTKDGKRGWVYVYRTTSEPPDQESKDEFLLLARGRDVRASEAETGSAIRGLEPVAEQNAIQNRTDPRIIEQFKVLDAYVIKDEELNAFMKEGRLGEYGG